MSDRYSKLDQLGQQKALPQSPDEAELERVKNPCDEPYMVRLVAPEFRNHGDFHEACTTGIGKRLVKEISPKWLRIGGYWYPRGGIPIDVFYQYGEPPKGLWIPDQGVPPYRGRG